ncbi:hypothetical protein HYC85_011305 [Camellia sinensis]|uniref:Receptor ligand binding region domain-containing protein n=1 Tax=Camellia sinensis TaxID=4442 RepID=A0A7J7H8Q1_CAMSI|nr:hypothetical protein HYC85_011305 [Camellia sinensis]
MMESRVYVVHINPDSGLTIFSVAKLLQMLTAGYIWIATDWLPSVLDSSESIDPNTMNLLQGIISLHHHTPDFDLKKSFTSRWKNFTYRETSSFNFYALYAYDSVWLLARALDVFFSEGGNISFSYDPRLHDINGSTLHLTRLRTFQEGQKLLQILPGMNFTGLTGQIQFDSEKNLILPAFDILNISGNGSQRIGYLLDMLGSYFAQARIPSLEPELSDLKLRIVGSSEAFCTRAMFLCVWSLKWPLLRSSESRIYQLAAAGRYNLVSERTGFEYFGFWDVDWILGFLGVLLEKHLINVVSNRNSSNVTGLSLSENEIRCQDEDVVVGEVDLGDRRCLYRMRFWRSRREKFLPPAVKEKLRDQFCQLKQLNT